MQKFLQVALMGFVLSGIGGCSKKFSASSSGLTAKVSNLSLTLEGEQSVNVSLSGGSGSYYTYNGCFFVGAAPTGIAECQSIIAYNPIDIQAQGNNFQISLTAEGIAHGTVKNGDVFTFIFYDTQDETRQTQVKFTAVL